MRFGFSTRVWMLGLAVVLTLAGGVAAQINTANLSGTVMDQSGAVVPGAKVTAKNLATGATRTTTSDDTGLYRLPGLAPGRYELKFEATGLSLVVPEVVLTIGQEAEFNPNLKVQAGDVQTVTVTGETEVIETTRTNVSETVNQMRIDNLPINGRDYLKHSLTVSQITRSSAPSIGAAPDSGFSSGGARPRSNQVSVDGADATDNSVNGVRATVSQEAVQEFQVIVSNYNAEFGRATGGVINIVTKSGTNAVHGNLFGFLRHKNIQARNPFSVEVDPATGAIRAVKQGYTRVQAGATIGGPIKEDKTFYFLAYETTRRQETGFTNIGAGNFGLVATPTSATLLAANPFLPATMLLTPTQAAFVNGTAPLAQRVAYASLVASGSQVALQGTDPGAAAALFGVVSAPNQPRFPLPIDCLPPAIPCTTANQVTLPASYVPLQNLIGNYPVSEGTSLWSVKFDHIWGARDSSFLRVNVTPSTVTGIQVNAQNQNFGQNAGSRTSLQTTRDLAIVGQHNRVWTNNFISEGRFQFARRGLHYGFSELPGGDQVAVNITGFAFFGREPFSTVDRIERRWQSVGNHTWTKGSHTWKFGSDMNLVQLRSKKDQIFELNFGGLYNFGGLAASSFAAFGIPATAPGLTAVQAYGLGLPTVFIQGIGRSDRPFNNHAYAGFIQDSWRIHRRLTMNYGVRYDYEHTPLFDASTQLNADAEDAFGVLEGIPRDKNNWSPRIALAWDPLGSGNTVVRLGWGMFYDHPLLAIAFNSVTAEGALSTQLLSGGGTATRVPIPATITTPAGFSAALSALNGASIFQGVLNAPANFGYLPAQQRFDPKLSGSIFADQNFLNPVFPIPLLPFTLHVDRDFEYAYAQQTNLTIEQKLGKDFKLSGAYTYTHGVHLNRPRNITPSDPGRLVRNFRNALAAGLTPSSPVAVAAPSTSVAPVAGGTVCGRTAIAPGVLAVLDCTGIVGPNAGFTGQFIGTAAAFNMFRPTGPNPSFAVAAVGLSYPTLQALATMAGFPTGPGVQVPWSDVVQQESSGNSVYHGLTVNLSKRFSNHFEFLSSWTWSHAIDDSTDLQTLLAPQNNNRPDLERSDSTFDQRHRWVVSGVFQSPYERSDDGIWRKFLADFTVAPLAEVSSGRPFTILTGSDFNLDFGSNTDRPSHVSSGGVPSFFLPEANTFAPPTVCPNDPVTGNPTPTIFAGLAGVPTFLGCTGDMGRNAFTRPIYTSVDLRISRRFHLTERFKVDFIMDAFNLFNRFNVGDVSPLCNPLDPAACRAGEPTAALDPRQFQFALKINW